VPTTVDERTPEGMVTYIITYALPDGHIIECYRQDFAPTNDLDEAHSWLLRKTKMEKELFDGWNAEHGFVPNPVPYVAGNWGWKAYVKAEAVST